MECVYSLCEPKPARAELLRVLRPGRDAAARGPGSQSSPFRADATRAALIGRLSTKAQLEAEFQQDFLLTDFCDLTQSLRQYLLQQMLFGGECALSAEDRACLRSVKPGYGLWIWKKS